MNYENQKATYNYAPLPGISPLLIAIMILFGPVWDLIALLLREIMVLINLPAAECVQLIKQICGVSY